MTDVEFNIIDELYFVTAYDVLQETTNFTDDILKKNLLAMVIKGWIKAYKTVDASAEIEDLDLSNHFRSYYYLASKKGLTKHNSK